jgi:L-lactate dehydrogenase complex protein LldG
MNVTTSDQERFTAKAEAVAATVSRVASVDEALSYVVDLCGKKEACQILASGCGEQLSDKAEQLCATKTQKTIAAPALDHETSDKLAALCKDNGFAYVTEGMREYLGGLDIGFTYAQWGIAETGTLVIDSRSEDLRLATMVSEVHVALVPASKIVPDAFALDEAIKEWFADAPNYLAFVTGASRTADIERVLALGVHGPLEMHVLILEDN